MEGVAKFKYLGRPLEQTDDNWPELRQNVKWAQRVWGRLVKMIIREGVESKVGGMFYRVVVQNVLLF